MRRPSIVALVLLGACGREDASSGAKDLPDSVVAALPQLRLVNRAPLIPEVAAGSSPPVIAVLPEVLICLPPRQSAPESSSKVAKLLIYIRWVLQNGWRPQLVLECRLLLRSGRPMRYSDWLPHCVHKDRGAR
jgi:hypothetical protein